MGRIKRGGGDGGDPARSPPGRLEVSPTAWRGFNLPCLALGVPVEPAFAPGTPYPIAKTRISLASVSAFARVFD
jgi:hypothetical protein